jgi:hypothetical protein
MNKWRIAPVDKKAPKQTKDHSDIWRYLHSDKELAGA